MFWRKVIEIAPLQSHLKTKPSTEPMGEHLQYGYRLHMYAAFRPCICMVTRGHYKLKWGKPLKFCLIVTSQITHCIVFIIPNDVTFTESSEIAWEFLPLTKWCVHQYPWTLKIRLCIFSLIVRDNMLIFKYMLIF